MVARRKRTIVGTLVALGLAVGITYETTKNVTHTSVGADSLLSAQLTELTDAVQAQAEDLAGLREAVAGVVRPSDLKPLAEDVAEVERYLVDLSTSRDARPIVYVVAGGSVQEADSATSRWIWKMYKGWPERERR